MSGALRRLAVLAIFAATLVAAVPFSSTAAEPTGPDISAGDTHTCATDADGAVSCWGDDSAGQVSQAVSGPYVSISAGADYTCALRTNETLACWGDGLAAQPGQVPPGQFGVISSGGSHACAIRLDRTLVCWGDDNDGEVSDAPGGQFLNVAAGDGFSCAVRIDTTLTCWGDDSANQVSDAPDGTNFGDISAGGAHACAIQADNTLTCWGDDSSGQLEDTPTGTFDSLSAGTRHTCAIRPGGAIACWGDDSAGQVSDAPEEGEFEAISAGADHTCAVSLTGDVVCWGGNAHGQSQPNFLEADLARGVIGAEYSHTFETTTMFPAPLFQLASGTLPGGLHLDGGGELAGTPTTAGNFNFTVGAGNGFTDAPPEAATLKVVGSPVLGAESTQGVTSTTAVLSARVNPRNLPAEAWFEYWPAASPESATHTPAQTIPAAVTQKGLTANIAGLTPDTQYAFRVAATNELGPNPVRSSVLALHTNPGPGIPPPVAGQSVNVDTAGGVVRVKCPGDSGFTTLVAATQIPVGCEVDTAKGTVALTASQGSNGATQSAYFWGGTFEIDQNPGDLQAAVATLAGRLRCEKRRGGDGAGTSALRRGGGRKLWGAGSGNFKTVGNYGSASVRGTTWLVIDRCDLSSVFEVKEGRVRVRDFIKRISLTIGPGKRYVAKAPFLRLR